MTWKWENLLSSLPWRNAGSKAEPGERGGFGFGELRGFLVYFSGIFVVLLFLW
jgi:hypothetical protein